MSEHVFLMAVDLKRLKKIKQEDKDLIYGYIRECEILLQKEIPSDIFQICALFWWTFEQFDKYGDNMKLLTSKSINDTVQMSSDIAANTAYGIYIADLKYDFIYEWIIKCIFIDSACAGIGIANTEDIDSNTCFIDDDDETYSYGLLADNSDEQSKDIKVSDRGENKHQL